jgi:hypothetical protein
MATPRRRGVAPLPADEDAHQKRNDPPQSANALPVAHARVAKPRPPAASFLNLQAAACSSRAEPDVRRCALCFIVAECNRHRSIACILQWLCYRAGPAAALSAQFLRGVNLASPRHADCKACGIEYGEVPAGG